MLMSCVSLRYQMERWSFSPTGQPLESGPFVDRISGTLGAPGGGQVRTDEAGSLA